MVSVHIASLFKTVDVSDFPDFHSLNSVLDQGLWVLFVSKEKLQVKKVSINDIVDIIRECEEVNVKPFSLVQAFRRHSDMAHASKEGERTMYEIMMPGKRRILAHMLNSGRAGIDVILFEPGKRFSSKRVLSQEILKGLNGDLRVIDPYCGVRTLDVLGELGKDTSLKFLTRIDNLNHPIGLSFSVNYLISKPNIH